MYTLILKNKDGLKLEFNSLRAAYNITNIQGLYPSKTTINTSESALTDGATFNSAKVNARTINLACTIEYPVEVNRLAIYKVLRPKEPITLYYKSPKLDVSIEAYVESITVGHFDVKQKATISLYCPFPYFQSAQEIIDEITDLTKQFHFPFYNPVNETDIIMGTISDRSQAIVVNNGGIETGLIFEIEGKTGSVSDITIYNAETSEYMEIDYTLAAGDKIVISTGQGAKTIQWIHDGVATNIFNALARGSSWLQLPAGGATFVYSVETGEDKYIEVNIYHSDLYEGV